MTDHFEGSGGFLLRLFVGSGGFLLRLFEGSGLGCGRFLCFKLALDGLEGLRSHVQANRV